MRRVIITQSIKTRGGHVLLHICTLQAGGCLAQQVKIKTNVQMFNY